LNIKFIFLFLFFSFSVNAHTFTGMIGFYDGIYHPVLGLDHFLAMVFVGILSVQIGGRAIFKIPGIFVFFMIIGGFLGMLIESDLGFNNQVIELSEIKFYHSLFDYVNLFIELGIILSVILLGLSITIQKKLPIKVIMIFVSLFGICHGTAHGVEMPWAINPIMFALGFSSGTIILHLFGVVIGMLSIKTRFSILLLRFSGILSIIYGFYLFFVI